MKTEKYWWAQLTEGGKYHAFRPDLQQDRYEPLCRMRDGLGLVLFLNRIWICGSHLLQPRIEDRCKRCIRAIAEREVPADAGEALDASTRSS